MWRIGLPGIGDEKVKTGKIRKTKEKVERKRAGKEKPIDKKKSMKMLMPISLEQTAKERRGSILAAEHLLMRRGSRASKQFNPADFAGLSQIAAGAIPLELPKSVQKYRRSSIVTSRLNKVKEIQDRVNKAVKEYESKPSEEASEASYLVKDIEEHLFNIEDDMLRINVSILLEKFRKMSLQRKDELRYLNPSRGGERKRELLESLQTWMEEDHFDMEDDEPRSTSPLPDADAVAGYLTQVEQNMKRVAGLEEKIKLLKSHGNDTAYLERQRRNLQRQVKQDVMDSEFRRRHSKVDSDKKQEFTYLKNAATEIYDMLNRTRMEGMAHSHQFEENLKQILGQMEAKDKDIEYLEKRVNQQKRLVKQWYVDYEKLQNDHILTKDEVVSGRKENKRLQSEVEQMKKRATELEKKKKMSVSKSEKEKVSKDTEQHLSTIKQKLEVVTWTLKEKEQHLEEQQRQIQQLKSALRKNSCYATESLYKPVEREASKSSHGKRDTSSSSSHLMPRDAELGARVVPPPTPSTISARDELESLKARVVTLEKEKHVLLENARKSADRKSSVSSLRKDRSQLETRNQSSVSSLRKDRSHLETRNQNSVSSQRKDRSHLETLNQETQTELLDATQKPDSDVIAHVSVTSCGVQTHSVPTLQYKSAKERRNLYQVAEQMNQQFGPQWTESALMLSQLEKDDIQELEHGIVCQNDYIRIFSGSPPHGGDTVPDEAEQQKITELKEAREDLVSCRVTKSIQQLAEEMLGGKDPQMLEAKNLAGINSMHSEMELMMKNVSGFVNKAQAVIGCQTGMMCEANEVIKKNLPSNVQSKLEKSKTKNGISPQLGTSCSEHSQEWKDMSLPEQIRCKLKLVEESMRNNVTDVMNVYISEVAKQHAEYSDIHTSVQEEPRIDVKGLVPNSESTMRNIQNKVESSMRYMARVTRAERGSTNRVQRYTSVTSQPHAMGEGPLNSPSVGRQAGTWTLGRRPTKLFHAQTAPEAPQPPLSLFGHAATESVQQKNQIATKSKPATSDAGGRASRPRDMQLARVRRTRLKPELRGLGMVVKSSAIQRESPQAVAHGGSGSSRFGPVVAGSLPTAQSYQDPRQHRRNDHRNSEGLTLTEIQKQLNVQIQKPQLQQARRSVIERIRSTPTPSEPAAPTLLISHVTKQLNPLGGAMILSRDVKLPKIF